MKETTIQADTVQKAGDVLLVLLPSISYGTTIYTNDKEGEVEFYKSFIANGVITVGLKYTVDEKRPDGENHSFPSAHTSIAFQSAVFIHKRYGIEYAIPAYLAASFVGYSRIESDKHYLHDVVAGAAIGTMCSYFFTTEYKGYEVAPIANSSMFGFSLTKKF